MILGPISYTDCAVFILFLIPQLLINVNWATLLTVGVNIVPFFLVSLPLGILRDWGLTPRVHRPAFVQHATGFQDVVIRCVRYAFANLPPSVGRVFFSKAVALPFSRFRMLRHGIFFSSPVKWYEIDEELPGGDGGSGNGTRAKGLWITGSKDESAAAPDLVVYYIHGGGFSMGSAYFYLEPLIAMRDLLVMAGYSNPAVFALEYSLVPDASYPTQIEETAAGYEYVLSRIAGRDAGRVILSGDSAGGTLGLSFLLHLAKTDGENSSKKPAYAAFISPWTNLVSARHVDTASDYLCVSSLHRYGSQYACGGGEFSTDEKLTDPLISPGDCASLAWWNKAAPTHGLYVTWGSEEVLGPDITELLKLLRKAGVDVTANEEPGGIHAWVIARLFLEESMAERSKGMQSLVNAIKANVL